VPKGLDPVARGHKLPIPDERPSARIAKLFPQTDPQKAKPADLATSGIAKGAAKDPGASAAKTPAAKDAVPAAPAATTSVAQSAPVAEPVPLPVARPDIPQPEKRRTRRYRHHRDQ